MPSTHSSCFGTLSRCSLKDSTAAHQVNAVTAGTRVWFSNPDYVFPDDRILRGAPRMIETPVLAEYSGERLVAFVQGGSISGGVIDRIPESIPRTSPPGASGLPAWSAR